jgi:hypothetical protein
MRSCLSWRTVAACLLFVAMMPVESVHATHLRAGEIIVERVNCQSLTFKITVTVYTNTGSSVKFGGRPGEEDILNFGDGTWELVPETDNTLRPDLGPNIGTASYTTFHTYSGNGRYMISYREPNRNEGVLNMDGSVNTRFYIETEIIIDPFLGCNNTPKLLIPPIDQACAGVAFFHNPGAYDPDGDSLSYELRIPFSDRNLPVINYRDPNDPEWYNDFDSGNEDKNGPPTFAIDAVDGTLLWDAPGERVGEFNIAFVVIEWRKVGNQWVQIGFVRRDMQIVVEECDNERPDLILPEDLCVEAGTIINETILGIDPENHNVKIEAFSEIFNFPTNEFPATYSPNPAVFLPSDPPYELNFHWETQCSHVKEQPYQVVFKITDQPTNGPKLVTFKTWNITVIGPKPVWESATLNPNQRTVTLDWDDYPCTNADQLQIWRRVDSFPFVPGECQTGMPDSIGYQLIATVPIGGATTYLDNNGGVGLAPGARYCYRLVALFPLPRRGESLVSDEICVDPIKADAPVITNVTVDKTSQTAGEITIKWLPPFEIDVTQFPLPYSYVLLRGEGQVGIPTTVVNAIPTDLLNFTDTGLNTEDLSYHYAVIVSNSKGPIDTSAIASSVRLEAASELNRINLSWQAFVPWSNLLAQYPEHDIYRGGEGQTEAQLVLIDQVNVVLDGFNYSDEGQWNGVPLGDDQTYCYRIMTRGGYGNPQIGEPLINYSQIICAQPSDTIPPCQVENLVAINAPDCTTWDEACDRTYFENQISWTRPNEGDCDNDIAYYRIYVSSSTTAEFVPHAITSETSFIDKNLPSYARCYKVSAVDRSGNEGPLSEALCIDNCPYYELPNVFTPGNNDNCNQLFSAYNDRPIDGGEEGGLCIANDPDKNRCARFVDKVILRVFNRWGGEVYTYSSGGERTIYVDWDGRDNNGSELASGVYYYVAEVTFVSIDPARRNQTLKGWVHLLR